MRLARISTVKLARLGKYELLRPLARSGLVERYLARVADFAGSLIVKRLLPKDTEAIDYVRALIEEATPVVSIGLPNVARIHNIGYGEDEYFVALENVQGYDLLELQERASQKGEPIPLDVATFLVASVLRGAHQVHTLLGGPDKPMRRFHYELRPDNIKVTLKGEVKLLDPTELESLFAEATDVDAPRMLRTAYMSPEQARGEPVDARADVFSAGVLLHELLARRRLFRRNTEPATRRAVLEDPIPPLSAIAKDVPSPLQRVVLAALRRPVEERYASAEAMREELEAAMREVGLSCDAERLAAYTAALSPPRAAPEAEPDGAAGAGEEGAAGPRADSDEVLEADEDSGSLNFELHDGGGMSEHWTLRDSQRQSPPAGSPLPPPVPPERPRRKGWTAAVTAQIQVPPGARKSRLRSFLNGFVAFLVVAGVVATGLYLVKEKGDALQRRPVTVLSEPPGAIVHLNGVQRSGVTPLTLEDVPAGEECTLVLVLDGYRPWQQKFTLKKGTHEHKIVATLERLGPLPGSAAIEVKVPDVENAEVYLDNELVGKAPLTVDQISTSTRHTLLVRGEGFEDRSIPIEGLKPGERRALTVTLEPAKTKLEQGVRKGSEPSPDEVPTGKGPVEVKRTNQVLPSLGNDRIGEHAPDRIDKHIK
jgi:eukaryotic-like serine/threonine-protein kinase